MAIISKETFEKFTEEEKKKLRDEYNSSYRTPNDRYILECTFGKENLQTEPEIKTWEDVMNEHPEYEFDIITVNNLVSIDFVVATKIVATYKIAKLIELGYGGIVSKKEYEENGAWQIIPYREAYNEKLKLKIIYGFQHKSFVSFHDEEQAEEFMSYPENVKLVEQYHMI